MLRDGVPRAFIMQTSEKIYVSFALETKDSGGHSSLPRPENAISRLARGLVALEDYRFPISLNETTRAYFAKCRITSYNVCYTKLLRISSAQRVLSMPNCLTTR